LILGQALSTLSILQASTPGGTLRDDGTSGWGVQALVGTGGGDLRDTVGSTPGFGVGIRWERPTLDGQRLRVRLDGFAFDDHRDQAAGVAGSNNWVRTVDTRVKAWTFGGEYLVTPLTALPRLRLGAGLHLVHWQIDSTDTTTFMTAGGPGQSVVSTSPDWDRLGVSLLADYRLTSHLSVELRWLASSYSWQGEKVQFGHLGLLWQF
jgi:hypothetical protein